MTDTEAAQPTADGADAPTIKRHPVRGVLWGALMGFGISLILIDRAVIALGTLTPLLPILAFAVLGGVWGRFAPPRGPTSPPPESEAPDQSGGSSDPSSAGVD